MPLLKKKHVHRPLYCQHLWQVTPKEEEKNDGPTSTNHLVFSPPYHNSLAFNLVKDES